MNRTKFLCYDCNTQTKCKLRDENKINIFLCMLSNFIWWKITKGTESIFYYDCII